MTFTARGIRTILICIVASGATALSFISQTTALAAESLSERRREEIIVLGSHTPRTARQVGSATSVLTSADLEARNVTAASDVLREVPGVAVNRGGPAGSLTQLRIRGAEANHTLVFIDGIEANDPASGAEYNFADLSAWGIGRIEILRGSQSALYGSEAIGGVIRVASPEAAPGLAARAQVQYGSFGSLHTGALLTAAAEAIGGILAISHYNTGGTSASAIDPEDDGYENTTLHLKLDADLSDWFSTRLVFRHQANEVESDRQDFDFPPKSTQGLFVDAANTMESSQTYGLAEVRAYLLGGRWEHTAGFGLTHTEANNYEAGALADANRGRREKFSYITTMQLAAPNLAHALTVGVQHERLRFINRVVTLPTADQRQRDQQTSVISEYSISYKSVATLGLSARHDDNQRFRNATTIRAAASYLFGEPQLRVHATYGEGISNPTFFELFGFFPDSFVGNPGLEPEQAKSWDIGAEQAFFGGRGLIDVTYFESVLRDELVTVFLPSFTSTVVNEQGKSRRKGLEIATTLQPSEDWLLTGSFTYLDAVDSDRKPEVRRPRYSGSVNLQRGLLESRGRLNVGAVFNGPQDDFEFVESTARTRVSLSSYVLVHVAAVINLTERFQILARAENLLNEDYGEVFGTRAPGIAAYLGIRAHL